MANHLTVPVGHEDFSIAQNIVHQAQGYFIAYLGLFGIDGVG